MRVTGKGREEGVHLSQFQRLVVATEAVQELRGHLPTGVGRITSARVGVEGRC